MADTPTLKDPRTATFTEMVQVENKSDPGLNEAHLPIYNDERTKRVLRKVDWRLLPVLTLLYVLSYLDRGNIGNARVAGMNKELKLSDKQYNMALTVEMRHEYVLY